MTPQEARDLAAAKIQADQLQARFQAIANAAAARLQVPTGTKVRYDLESCEWIVPDPPPATAAPTPESA